MGGRQQSSSSSTGKNQQVSSGITQSGQTVWGPQADALAGLYNSMGEAMNPQAWQGSASDFATLSDKLQRQGQGALAGLQGFNPQQQIAAQEDSLRAGLDNLVANQTSQIASNAASSGAFGGARHGVMEGTAIGEASRAYTEGLGDITARANQQGILANQSIGAMLPQLSQMGMQPGQFGQQMMFNPLQTAAGIYGTSPQTLSFSQALQYAMGKGTQQSKSDSSGWNIDNFFGTIF